ncbi:hypothetical protein [Mesorhizobium sp.]|uniref:hypothetical protein n=1 Tax=Mesorhizobium sp. TaxID=1871066 RepID=UPI00258AC05B|nr:hypothetical protein [Mesorhizobium sp.]
MPIAASIWMAPRTVSRLTSSVVIANSKQVRVTPDRGVKGEKQFSATCFSGTTSPS